MTRQDQTFEGGCHCGAHRFFIQGEPKFVANCHCESCRKTTGAAFSTWVGFREDQVRWQNARPAYYSSSHGVERGFCKKCGTPLTYSSDKWPGETHFLIGVFDDPAAFTPRTEVFTHDALKWAIGRFANE